MSSIFDELFIQATKVQPKAQPTVPQTMPADFVEQPSSDAYVADYDEDDNETGLEGLETKPSFSLNLPGLTPAQPTATNILDLFQTGQQENVMPVRRGRGRPRKIETVETVLQAMPSTLETEGDKSQISRSNTSPVSEIEAKGQDIIMSLPASVCFEIGENLERIGRAIRVVALQKLQNAEANK